jgi:hypothetical protein
MGQKVESVIVTCVIYVEEKSSKPAFWSIYFCVILLSKMKKYFTKDALISEYFSL